MCNDSCLCWLDIHIHTPRLETSRALPPRGSAIHCFSRLLFLIVSVINSCHFVATSLEEQTTKTIAAFFFLFRNQNIIYYAHYYYFLPFSYFKKSNCLLKTLFIVTENIFSLLLDNKQSLCKSQLFMNTGNMSCWWSHKMNTVVYLYCVALCNMVFLGFAFYLQIKNPNVFTRFFVFYLNCFFYWMGIKILLELYITFSSLALFN